MIRMSESNTTGGSSWVRALLCGGSVLVALAGTAPVSAQSTPAAEDDNALQEIVVTAQRRSESVLSVPLSIEARSGDQLLEAGIRGAQDLKYTSPGFAVADADGFAQLYIRGVGNAIYVGADPSVTTYVDDVPRVFGSLIANFVDVERVEVLKGAQGGLYGRNATGGVVNIITRQPSTDAVKAQGLVSYGERKSFRGTGFINLPLGEKIALSVSGERNKHGAYVKNLARPNPYTAAMFPNGANLQTGPIGANGAPARVFNTPEQTAAAFNSYIDPSGINTYDLWSVNAKLLVNVTDDFKITFAGDYSKLDGSQGQQYTQDSPASAQIAQNFVRNLFTAFGVAFNPPADFFTSSNFGTYTTSKGLKSKLQLTDYGMSATAVLSLEGVDISSITSYRKHDPFALNDLPGLNVPGIRVENERKASSIYQEIRLLSTGGGPFSFIGGGTYLKNKYRYGGRGSRTDIVPPLIVGAPTFSAQKVTNWTVYAQGAYDVTPDLTVTASGRYVHEKNRTSFTAPRVSSSGAVEKKFLPAVTLSYKLDGGGNIYARWARGFKGGGVNPVVAPSIFATPRGSVFSGETVDTYEAGYRAQLLDRTIQVTAAVFYNDYKNLQVAVGGNAQHPEITFAIVNAGAARTYGAEGSLTWRVVSPFTLAVAGGYLNAKYKNFAILGDPILISFDQSGQRMALSPKYQLSISGNLDQPVTDQFRLVGNVLFAYQSYTKYRTSARPGVLPEAGQPGYWITNARIGVRTADDKYGLAVFATNVFNKFYTTFGGSNASIGNTNILGSPRIVGVELTAKF